MPQTLTDEVKSGAFLLGPTDPAAVFVPELFDEESRMLGASVEEFVRDEVLPKWDAIDAQEDGVLEGLVRATGELGVFSVDVPEALGGLGASKKVAMLVAEKIGLGGSYAPAVMVQTGIGGLPIVYFGTPDHHERYLEGIMSGKLLTAYALTEAGSGSDALAARSTARWDEERGVYLLNGSKQFITNATFADVFIVFAKVDGDKFTAFILDREMDGFTVGIEEKKLGLKGSSTCSLAFDDVPVPKANVLGEIGKGHRIAFNVLNIGRLKLSPAVLGGAKIALQTGAKYALERKQFGKPIAEFGLIQQKLAGSAMRIYAAESLIYRTAGMIDDHIAALRSSGELDGTEATVRALKELAVECSINKVYGSEAIDYVVDEVLQIHGGYGYVSEYPAERYYRDARINRIWEGTSEINRMLITGTLLDRAMKGTLSLLPAVKSVTDELMSRRGRPEEPEGPLGEELRAIDNARKMTLFSAGVAAQKFLTSLKEQQEVLSWLADMVIQTYAMESVALRAVRLRETLGDEEFEDRRAVARFALETGMPIVEHAAQQVLSASADGEELRSMLSMLRKLTRRQPFSMRDAGRRVARAVIRAEGYPFA